MQRPGFELIFGVPDNRPLVTVVQRPVATLPTLGDKGHVDPTFPTKSADFPNEFIACHGL